MTTIQFDCGDETVTVLYDTIAGQLRLVDEMVAGDLDGDDSVVIKVPLPGTTASVATLLDFQKKLAANPPACLSLPVEKKPEFLFTDKIEGRPTIDMVFRDEDAWVVGAVGFLEGSKINTTTMRKALFAAYVEVRDDLEASELKKAMVEHFREAVHMKQMDDYVKMAQFLGAEQALRVMGIIMVWWFMDITAHNLQEVFGQVDEERLQQITERYNKHMAAEKQKEADAAECETIETDPKRARST